MLAFESGLDEKLAVLCEADQVDNDAVHGRDQHEPQPEPYDYVELLQVEVDGQGALQPVQLLFEHDDVDLDLG